MRFAREARSIGLAVALGSAMLAGPLQAQTMPRSFEASPDVYKVIAESDQMRIIKVAWKPGQKDRFHSHPAAGTYFLTSCSLRFEFPDGSKRDSTQAAGTASARPPIASHAVENIGQSDCELVMFEPK
jgi:hypothetical protein